MRRKPFADFRMLVGGVIVDDRMHDFSGGDLRLDGSYGMFGAKQERGVQLQSTLTCPKCGYQAVETMPTDACQFFYDCKGCGERLKPLAGDCCVFCSYGSVPCPPIQSNLRCCVPKVH
jgi:hypothetical protein